MTAETGSLFARSSSFTQASTKRVVRVVVDCSRLALVRSRGSLEQYGLSEKIGRSIRRGDRWPIEFADGTRLSLQTVQSI